MRTHQKAAIVLSQDNQLDNQFSSFTHSFEGVKLASLSSYQLVSLELDDTAF
jgi:hypothetical protein